MLKPFTLRKNTLRKTTLWKSNTENCWSYKPTVTVTWLAEIIKTYCLNCGTNSMNILTWLMSQSGRPDIFCFFIGLFILGYLGFSVILAHAVFLWFGHLYFSRPADCISHLPLWYLLFLYRLFIWGYLPPSSCSVAVKHSPLLSHKPDTNRSNAFQLIKQMWTFIQSHASRCFQRELCIRLCKFHEQQIISETTFCCKLSVIQFFVAKGL